MKKDTSPLGIGHSVTGPCGPSRPQMFAVINVVDFWLQSVLRTDSTLGMAKAAPEKSIQADTTVRPPGEFVGGRAAVPASFALVAESPASYSSRPAPSLPVAIVSSETKKSLVLQTNARARAAGVECGMTAPQAQARCADLVFRQRSSSAETEAQSLLLTCALHVAPSVENTAPGLCTIEVSGVAAEDRSRVLAHVICELRDLGLSATAGIAATPLLARYAAQETTSVRTVENPSAFLHALPLQVAEPAPELTAILGNWGITTIGQFTALPQQEVIRRLGADGLALWQRAQGGQPRPLHLYTPPQPFFATLDLEYEIETTEGVLFILRRFVDRLALELRTAGFVAAEMTLGLKLADETTHERSFRFPEATAEEEILFRTLYTYLESLRTPSCVVGASLHLAPVRPLVRQPGLFETGLRDPHGFSETLSRVTAIVGNDRLGTPTLEDTHRPDAVKLSAPLSLVPALEQPPVWPSLGLPLRRFRPPRRAQVELTPQGRPAFISNSELHSPITAARGPWQSSGEWWKPETWSREEWDIEVAVGGLYRVAKIGDVWYLEGEYE